MNKIRSVKTKSPLEEKHLRRPGQSLDEKIGILKGKMLLWVILVGLIVGLIVLEWAYYFIQTYIIKSTLQPTIATILAALFVLICLWNASRIKKEIQNYQLGRDGEREVAERFENLIRLTGCYVYHDIVCESHGVKFNIDHIIVSNRGIFVIETKTRSKIAGMTPEVQDFNGQSIRLAGHPPDSQPIEQVRRNVRWLRDQIPREINGKPVEITAIVVYPGWYVDKAKMNKSKDTWVSNAKYLEFAIMPLESKFTSEEVELLCTEVRILAHNLRKTSE